MSLNPESFKEKLGTWHNKLLPLFENGTMDNIFSHLKGRSREGYKILPESENVFRCFIETPFDELKVVMMGLAPYNSVKDGIAVADGLLMSCSNTGYIQPSLSAYYKSIEKEYKNGLDLNMYENPSLSFLANQGVLLYNISLTTEIGKSSAHLDIWKPFTIFLLEEIISITGVPVLFLGKEAGKFSRYLAPMQWNFTVEHPAASSYRGSDWLTDNVFHKIDKVLYDTNKFKVKWYEEYPF